MQTQTYKNQKLSQIVGHNMKAAEILEENHIDFCCGGDKTLDEACQEQNISPQPIEQQLHEALQEKDSETEFIKNLDPAELSDYITKRHHAFVREQIPRINKHLDKICEVHSKNHPELYKVKEEFEKASRALESHMADEENILFPYIREMMNARSEGRFPNLKGFHTVEGPIQKMLEEHENEGARFDRLDEMTHGFGVPDDGCNTFRLTYQQLEEFKKDLHKHIHLENNILFPEAKRLEQKLKKQ
jgi:regulator of cell morphogenesis and NO signaling